MARQEQLFAQTITDMKRAMLRKGDDSEVDDLVDKPTNRGNKLKRKAKFVEEGRLDLANSVQAYRKKVNYNGFVRQVISKNPMRVDPDGDVVDDEDDDSNAGVEDLEEDPYGEVKIERLLMPLTSAAELKNHPSLSVPYRSKILDEMILNAQDMMFREEDALWRIRQLADEFQGDSPWRPVGDFETANDMALLRPGIASVSLAPSVATDGEVLPPQSADWESMSNAQLMENLEDTAESGTSHLEKHGVSIVDMQTTAHGTSEAASIAAKGKRPRENESRDSPAPQEHHSPANVSPQNISDAEKPPDDQDNASKEPSTVNQEGLDQSQATNGSHPAKANSDDVSKEASDVQEQHVNGENEHNHPEDNDGQDGDEAAEDDEAAHPPHRMTTRAKAQAANSPDPNSPRGPGSPSNAMQYRYIHPFFIPPDTALPTKEAGLPFVEADETRRLICAYAQKQEEVCRGATKLYDGLLRAKKMRDDVLEWCQAEGHIGEMDDGEDWYDREKWGLTEDLKKGEDFDEEEANVTGKTRRNRRAARDA